MRSLIAARFSNRVTGRSRVCPHAKVDIDPADWRIINPVVPQLVVTRVSAGLPNERRDVFSWRGAAFTTSDFADYPRQDRAEVVLIIIRAGGPAQMWATRTSTTGGTRARVPRPAGGAP